MKKTSVLMIAALVITFANCTVARSQEKFSTQLQPTIEPMSLYITTLKTTNLIFGSAIKSVDRGTRDILVQKAKNVENVLQLKAATDSFTQTNLSVITADGAIYTFTVSYMQQPPTFTVEIAPRERDRPSAIFSEISDFNSKLADLSENVMWRNTKASRKRTKHGVRIALTGIFSKHGLLYFKFNLGNATNLEFEIDQLRFYIKDQKRAKRTATQTIELNPEYIHGYNRLIYGKSEKRMVVALKRFNIPDKKELIIQLMEKDGGRHISLNVKNRQILKAVAAN